MLVVLIGCGLLAGPASADPGQLTHRGCFTADSFVPAAANGCSFAETSKPDGDDTGLDDLTAADVSPDGSTLYAVASEDAAVLSFDRDGDGALTYRACLTADSDVAAGANACAYPSSAAAEGENTGFHGFLGVEVSPDGRSLYAVAEHDAAVLSFDRAADGTLTYRGCFTADSDVPDGANGCVHAVDEAPAGLNTGFGELHGVVVSPDGRSVYAISEADAALLRFDRAAGGALTYRGCLTADSDVPLGANGCVRTPASSPGGANTGLHELFAVDVSADGSSIYAASTEDAAVLRFDRSAAGAITYRSCFTADAEIPAGTNGCVEAETKTTGGANTGFGELFAVDVSVDGRSVYASSNGDASIVRFDRAPGGSLTYRGCFTADSDVPAGANACEHAVTSASHGENTGFDELRSIVVSPDDRSLYAIANNDGSIVRFDRRPGGRLTYRDCFTADNEIPGGANACTHATTTTPFGLDTGIDALVDVIASPDGRSAYAVSEFDSALVRFDRQLPPPPALSLAAKRKQRSAKRIVAELSCDAGCAVKLTGKLRVPVGRRGGKATRSRSFTLNPAAAELVGGAEARLALKVPARARKALKRAMRAKRRGRAKLAATAADPLGTTSPRQSAKVTVLGKRRRG